MTSDEHAEVKRLKRENAELRCANEILKAAAAYFGAELDRPQQRCEVHRRAQGPSRRGWSALGCRADLRGTHRAQPPDRLGDVLRRETRPPSVRSVRDEELKPVIAHGAHGELRRLRRPQDTCRVAPTRRGDRPRPDRPADARAGPGRGPARTVEADHDPGSRRGSTGGPVNREFRTDRPDQLWVCDLTHIRTWTRFAYLTLVISVFSRRIVGWARAVTCASSCPSKHSNWRSGPASRRPDRARSIHRRQQPISRHDVDVDYGSVGPLCPGRPLVRGVQPGVGKQADSGRRS